MIRAMATASNGTTSPGRKIRRQRQILRLTQQELADLVGADRSAVSAWERDMHFPQRYAGAIEHALGISLTDGEESRPPRRVIPEQTKAILRAALPDGDDYDRVIALLERPEDDGDRGARAG